MILVQADEFLCRGGLMWQSLLDYRTYVRYSDGQEAALLRKDL